MPLDDGVAKDASASTAWRNIWRSYRDRYAAFAAKPDLDWEQVRETFAADVDDAVTQVQAEWAISRGVQALQDGHVFVRPPRLCALDPGFGASQSNVDACVEETDEGLVVAKVGPTNPMGFAVGDLIVSFDGRTPEEALADVDAQPRCQVAHSTSAALRQTLVHSVMFRDVDDTFIEVERDDGRVVSLPTTTVETPLRCRGGVGPNPLTTDVQNLGHDVVAAVLPGDIQYLRWARFGSTADGAFDAEPVQTLLLTTIAQARGRRGLILDIRGNEGGLDAMFRAVVQALVRDPTVFMLRRFRDGASWGPMANIAVERNDDAIDVDVAVLTDAASVSAADFLAACLTTYGRATAFGAPTSGAFGAASTSPSVFDFTLVNNWAWVVSVDGMSLPGAPAPGDPMEGHPPDVGHAVRATRADLTAGVDTVLEAARVFLVTSSVGAEADRSDAAR